MRKDSDYLGNVEMNGLRCHGDSAEGKPSFGHLSPFRLWTIVKNTDEGSDLGSIVRNIDEGSDLGSRTQERLGSVRYEPAVKRVSVTHIGHVCHVSSMLCRTRVKLTTR